MANFGYKTLKIVKFEELDITLNNLSNLSEEEFFLLFKSHIEIQHFLVFYFETLINCYPLSKIDKAIPIEYLEKLQDRVEINQFEKMKWSIVLSIAIDNGFFNQNIQYLAIRYIKNLFKTNFLDKNYFQLRIDNTLELKSEFAIFCSVFEETVYKIIKCLPYSERQTIWPFYKNISEYFHINPNSNSNDRVFITELCSQFEFVDLIVLNDLFYDLFTHDNVEESLISHSFFYTFLFLPYLDILEELIIDKYQSEVTFKKKLNYFKKFIENKISNSYINFSSCLELGISYSHISFSQNKSLFEKKTIQKHISQNEDDLLNLNFTQSLTDSTVDSGMENVTKITISPNSTLKHINSSLMTEVSKQFNPSDNDIPPNPVEYLKILLFNDEEGNHIFEKNILCYILILKRMMSLEEINEINLFRVFELVTNIKSFIDSLESVEEIQIWLESVFHENKDINLLCSTSKSIQTVKFKYLANNENGHSGYNIMTREQSHSKMNTNLMVSPQIEKKLGSLINEFALANCIFNSSFYYKLFHQSELMGIITDILTINKIEFTLKVIDFPFVHDYLIVYQGMKFYMNLITIEKQVIGLNNVLTFEERAKEKICKEEMESYPSLWFTLGKLDYDEYFFTNQILTSIQNFADEMKDKATLNS